jgi:putative MATE family efflux protein
MYNIADTLIVGNLLGNNALAAVSSSGSLVFLLVSLFNGVSMGSGVVISRFFGAKDVPRMQKAVHTAFTFSLTAGIAVSIFGALASPQILIWMDTPTNVLPESVAYLRVYFAGALGMVLYNCCMGIMQAVGDSKHPLQYLIISSILNVGLDIVMIVVFKLGVGGAALATIISNFVSVFLCLFRLVRVKADYRLNLRKLGFDLPSLSMIVRYGLPSGLQNSIIALANVVVQSNINSFGEMAMAGCGAYAKIEGFAFLPINSFTMAITTFVSQNLGAREFERTKKGARFGMLCSVSLAELIGVLIFASAPLLVRAFTSEPEAIAFGVQKARTCAFFFCLLAFSHCIAAILRGAGRAVVPMVTMMAFWCIVRVAFLSILTPIFRDIAVVNWVYPLTWSLSSIALLIYYLKANWLYGFADEGKHHALRHHSTK